MNLASHRKFLADSAARLMKVIFGGVLLAIIAPQAGASGICLTVGSSVYGGGILGTAPSPFVAGCTYGLSTNVGTFGGVVTSTPAVLCRHRFPSLPRHHSISPTRAGPIMPRLRA